MTGRATPLLSSHAQYTGATAAASATLREWYAGLALQGLLANGIGNLTPDMVGIEAVLYADALIDALAGEGERA